MRFADMHAMIFDPIESRTVHHVHDFRGATPTAEWHGALACEDISSYQTGEHRRSTKRLQMIAAANFSSAS